jgi:Disulphide bond corrector protein DsbC
VRATPCSAAIGLATFFMIGLLQQSFAQPAPVVQWTAVIDGKASALELSATVQEGWHVYAASQLPGGPTPLRVTLEEGAGAKLTGVASGTVPEKRHDTSFDLDTEFYTHAFSLHLPIAWRTSQVSATSLTLAVRYQTCSDRECQPPRTVHLSVPVSGAAP